LNAAGVFSALGDSPQSRDRRETCRRGGAALKSIEEDAARHQVADARLLLGRVISGDTRQLGTCPDTVEDEVPDAAHQQHGKNNKNNTSRSHDTIAPFEH
jgi:hypothetical protein